LELSKALLIVDDEASVRDLLAVALEEAGYTILMASDAKGAVAILDELPAKHRAVITDVNLGPDILTGWDIARLARQRDPDMAIVYMSGASGHQWPSHGVPGSILVPKPFAPAQMVMAVSQLLNRGDPSPL